MSKRIFITTNWDSLNNSVLPVAAPNRNGDNKGIDTLSVSNPILYYNANFQTTEEDDAVIILLHDNSYTNTITNIAIKGDDFLLHHSRPNNPTPNYEDKFGKNKTHGIHALHDTNYPAVFKIIFEGNNPSSSKVDKILDVLGFGIEQKKHDANIQLYKSLSLFPLKLKEAWKTPNFIKEIDALKEKDGLELVKNKLDAIFFKETVEEFYEQLEPIETEIINFSTAPQCN